MFLCCTSVWASSMLIPQGKEKNNNNEDLDYKVKPLTVDEICVPRL